MANNTRDPGTSTGRSRERHTGSDALIKFRTQDPTLGAEENDEVYEIPVTNVQWTIDYTMEEAQHNGTLEATLSTSEIRYNGSFEWDGQNPEAMSTLLLGAGNASDLNHVDQMRPTRFNMTVQEYNRQFTKSNENYEGNVRGTGDGEVIEQTVVFRRCLPTSIDRDLSSGELSSATIDWEAEAASHHTGPRENK